CSGSTRERRIERSARFWLSSRASARDRCGWAARKSSISRRPPTPFPRYARNDIFFVQRLSFRRQLGHPATTSRRGLDTAEAQQATAARTDVPRRERQDRAPAPAFSRHAGAAQLHVLPRPNARP